MFKDSFYDNKKDFMGWVDVIFATLWISIKIGLGKVSVSGFFTLILILIIIPIVINYLANNFTKKGKSIKEIKKQSNVLRKQQDDEEKTVETIKNNEKIEKQKMNSNKLNSTLAELKEKGINYHKIICVNNSNLYFSYVWVENNIFSLLVDKNSYDTSNNPLFDNNGLITCDVQKVSITDNTTIISNKRTIDAHISITGAVIGGLVGGTAGAIIGGQQPTKTKTSVEYVQLCFLNLDKMKIEIDKNSVPLIKDLIKDLKIN